MSDREEEREMGVYSNLNARRELGNGSPTN